MSKKIKVKNETPIPCKLILVGESGVGKTSIISRYLNKYEEKTESTLGAYFSNKEIIVDSYKLNFEIWDTAGQEQYRAINNLFYKDAFICLLVYDVTNKRSYEAIKEYWYDAVIENGREGIIIGIAGNKNDLYENESIKEEEVEKFSNSINACFKLTSAKLNSSIDDIFQMLGEKFVHSDFMPELEKMYIINDNNIKNQNIKMRKDKKLSEQEDSNKNSGCC